MEVKNNKKYETTTKIFANKNRKLSKIGQHKEKTGYIGSEYYESVGRVFESPWAHLSSKVKGLIPLVGLSPFSFWLF